MPCKYVIDTSSLLILVRYYMSLDANGVIETCVKQQHDDGALGVLRQVQRQAHQVAKGLIFQKMPFLDNEQHIIDADWKTSTRVDNKVKHSWCSGSVKSAIIAKSGDVGLQQRVEQFQADADFKLIHYSLRYRSTVITEETSESNDGKLFHKIPKICRMEGVECIDIIEYMKRLGIKADFHL